MLLLTLIVIIQILKLLLGYKTDYSIMCCGLFGGSAKPKHTLDLEKIKTLGLCNMVRGVDSCGYYYNGYIDKGVNDTAQWVSLIANKNIVKGESPCDIFIGHTRKSTVGANIFDNAHPHEVDNNYIQSHNGTLSNHWNLCNKYGVDHTKITVDSIALAHLINKQGWSILNDYVGYAALAMTWRDKPGYLYLYHGASKDKTTDANMWIERPLFYIEQDEGIYYSSMPDSLS